MWLLIGGDSEIGAATARRAEAMGRPVLATTRQADRAGPQRPLLDLAAPLDDWVPPPGTDAACIFAAVARIAACQADPAGSAYINVTQTLELTRRLLKSGAYVLFLSTNQVFDGRTPGVPADAPACPVSEYGRQKARTEALMRELIDDGAPIAILRLAKVTSPQMPLLHAWLDALAAGKPIRAFSDMTMAPTPLDLVTAAIAALMRDRAAGVFQLTGPADATYAEIGLYLARRLGAPSTLVEVTSTEASGMPAGSAPAHTTLDSSALRERYGIAVPDVWPVIDAVFARWRGREADA